MARIAGVDLPNEKRVEIGLTYIFGIGLTGTSVNPARSLAPAVLTGGTALSQVWVFILAPFVGAALAALVYKFLESSKADTKAK